MNTNTQAADYRMTDSHWGRISRSLEKISAASRRASKAMDEMSRAAEAAQEAVRDFQKAVKARNGGEA